MLPLSNTFSVNCIQERCPCTEYCRVQATAEAVRIQSTAQTASAGLMDACLGRGSRLLG